MHLTHAIRAAQRRRCHLIARWGRFALAAGGSLLAAGAVAAPAAAAPSSPLPNATGNFDFATLDNQRDPTFNQLLGINTSGVIAGYFGSGAAGHPNKGYVLSPPYTQRNYRNENFPGSAQTQVTGLNNDGVTVGFWVNKKGANFGFYNYRGRFHNVNFPTNDNASPHFDQLLGVNDHGIAVGFYNDAKGSAHAFTYNINRGTFHRVLPNATSATAAAINNNGDIAGFYTNSAGTQAFLLYPNGHLITIPTPAGASMIQGLGVNDGDEVVGVITTGSGSSATTDGFIWAPGFGLEQVDDPNPGGAGSTTINGVNDRGQLVGFYADTGGNTHGLLATPHI